MGNTTINLLDLLADAFEALTADTPAQAAGKAALAKRFRGE